MRNDPRETRDDKELLPTELEERMRRAILADMAQAGGWPEGRLSMEVLYLLPRDFINSYIQLFHTALKEQAPVVSGKGMDSVGAGKAKGAASGLQTGRGKNGTRLQAQGGGKKYKTQWMINSERALAKKQRIDAQLRELAIEMSRQGGEAGQCRKCRKFLRAAWKFCPGCGAPK